MKKPLLSLFVIFLSTVSGYLIWKTLNGNTSVDYSGKLERVVRKKTPKPIEQTGIYESQLRDYELTRDISLGYVPKDRLVSLTSELMKAEVMRGGRGSSALGITLEERGPYADIAGPQGNYRIENTSTAGRVRAVWVDLADPTFHTVWVGGVAGGIWKTTDIQNTDPTWTLVSDYFDNMAIGGICQDPTNHNIMYFGTGEKTNNLDRVRGGGVWKSTDHGVTWNLLPSTTGFINVSKILCDNAGNVYVATIGSTGLRRSTDKGATWTNISPIGKTTYITDMELSATGRLHIVCGYRSSAGESGPMYTDNPSTVTSSTWNAPVTTFPAQYNSDIAVAGNILYALPANSSWGTPTLYKSIDGGVNWASTGATIPSDAYSGIAWYCLALAVNPANTNNVIVGGLNVFRTTDGGNSWNKISLWAGSGPYSYVHADQQYAVWNGDQIIVASDGGISLSQDGGYTFKNRNTGLRIKQFYSVASHPTDYNYFLGGTQDNGSHKLYKPGLDSSIEVTGGDGAFVHIDQIDPQYQFTSYVYNQYRRSTDGGKSWTGVDYSTTIGSFINPTDYDSRSKTMYCGADNNRFIRWDNAISGRSFTAVPLSSLGGTIRHVSVSPYTLNRVFFGSSSGKIIRVDNANDDNTLTATTIKSGTPTSNISCIAVGTNDNNLLATYSNYGAQHVWLTNDGGTSWTNVSGNLPDMPVWWAVFYPESNTKAIIATEAGVWETDNLNGSSTVWERNTTFPFVRTDMLKYRRGDNSLAAATHGRGIFTAQLPTLPPYARFAFSSMSFKETTESTTDGCRYYKDYLVNVVLDAAASGSETLTVNLKPGGTAIEGQDFEFTTNGNFTSPSHTITVPVGSKGPYPVSIRIYNDAEVESAETFTLSLSVSGTTNALVSPSFGENIIEIRNGISAPSFELKESVFMLGGRQYYMAVPDIVLDINMKSRRSQSIYRAAELRDLGMRKGVIKSIGLDIEKYSISAYKNLNIKLGTSTYNYPYDATGFHFTNTTVYKSYASYNTVNGINTFVFDHPFEWDGVSNVVIEICYDNLLAGSESRDKVIGYGDGSGIDVAGIIGQNNINCDEEFSLPWKYNTSGIRPRVEYGYLGSDNNIATSGTRTETVYNNGIYYFYNGDDVISRIKDATTSLGCVTSQILATGTDWLPYANKSRSAKVFQITPGSSTASYNVGIYLTTAEMGGRTPADVVLVKTDATAINPSGGHSSDTQLGFTTYETYDQGYLFIASFTGFTSNTKFFLSEKDVVIPVKLQSFTGAIHNDYAVLNWKTASEQNTSYFEVQKSSNGSTGFTSIGRVNAAGNSNTVRDYSLTDNRLAAQNYYRLKIVDKDGRYEYSNTLLLRYSGPQKLTVVGNPFRNEIKLHFARVPEGKVKAALFNTSGARVFSEEYAGSDVISVMPDNMNRLSEGIYILRVSADGRVYTERVLKRK
ncbi:MAG: T9SS type A sorting domain-containing protein [Chitinophagaceae bacterium]|nr:T9SS type A sorting domain-containing protein [Chitinophagaceae bacterium]